MFPSKPCISVPAEFHNLLQYYTKQGYRVIGAAARSLKYGLKWNEVDSMSRSGTGSVIL